MNLEYTIEFDTEPGRITIRTSGRPDRDAVLRFLEELADDPRFRPGVPVVADHRGADWSLLRSEDIAAIAARTSRLVERVGTGPYAIVVPDALAFGLARMTEAQVSPELRMAIFYSLDDALAWLEKATAKQ